MNGIKVNADALKFEIAKKERNKITYTIKYPYKLENYFNKNKMEVIYDCDISEIPDSILIIPPVLAIGPISWYFNIDIHVDTVDQHFFEYFNLLNESVHKHIFLDKGTPSSEMDINTVNKSKMSPNGNGLLFTGGVDSSAAYFSEMEQITRLITLSHGKYANEEWNLKTNYVNSFSDFHDVDCSYIRSNIKTIIDHDAINQNHSGSLRGSWWGELQYLLGYVGLCAPIAHKYELGSLFVGSGHSEHKFRDKIVENLGWNDTSCEIIRNFTTRHQKIQYLSDTLDQFEFDYDLRHRYSCDRGLPTSCSKCNQTYAGFITEGVDPNNIGFDLENPSLSDVFPHLNMVNVGITSLSEVHADRWIQIQNNVDGNSFVLANELEQFSNYDFREMVKKSNKNNLKNEFAKAQFIYQEEGSVELFKRVIGKMNRIVR